MDDMIQHLRSMRNGKNDPFVSAHVNALPSQPSPGFDDAELLVRMEKRLSAASGSDAYNNETFGDMSSEGWSFEQALAANKRLRGEGPCAIAAPDAHSLPSPAFKSMRAFPKPCLGLQYAHLPTWKSARTGDPKYQLFKAAQDGCLACVKDLIQASVDPSSVSTNMGLTAADYAAWGTADGCSAVVQYLQTLGATSKKSSQREAKTECGVMNPCSGCARAHVPKWKSARAGERKYTLFRAAEDGCLACVKDLILEGIDPFSVSTNCGYTAADYAGWGTAEGCQEVLEHLHALGVTPKQPQKRARVAELDILERTNRVEGLATPIESGFGYRMLGKMGWKPGAGLRDDGIKEPLSVVVKHGREGF